MTKKKRTNPNGGRKPVEDKKIAIAIYLRQSKITKLGGADKVRTKLLKVVGE